MTRPTATVTIGNTSLGVEHDEKLIKALLAEGNDQVRIDLEDVSDEHVDTLFGSLMQSAMASGGRRLAMEWMKRLDVPGNAGERAHHAMAQTINLQLQFGMLSPPLAEQAGCRPELLKHEQQHADAITRLAVHGIATDGEVHKMRQRLVKCIVKAVSKDTQPQTVSTTTKKSQ